MILLPQMVKFELLKEFTTKLCVLNFINALNLLAGW